MRTRGDARDLYVIDRDGTHEVALTNDGRAGNGYSWSPDSQRLVFVRGDKSSGDLMTIRPDGSNLEPVTRDGSPKFTPRWSPDGQHIVYAQGVLPELDLFVVNPDGSNLHRLTHESGREITPTWSQNSQYVAYLALAPGHAYTGDIALQEPGSLEIIATGSRKVTVLFRGKGLSVFPIAWQPPPQKGYPPPDGFQHT